MIFDHAPVNRTALWHPNPASRGSFDILSTCLITLGLCIWTAVHLNIPEHTQTKRKTWDPRGWVTKQQWRKVGWLMIGVLAPEMVAFTAWHQRAEARYLTKEMKKFLAESSEASEDTTRVADHNDVEMSSDSSDSAPRRYPWTDVHSFYVIMGGFAFDTIDLPLDQKFLPGGRDRVTLTLQAVLFLAEHDPFLVPKLSQDEILDKSKANHLAKGIICVQALWFTVETIARISQGLSISLLELNTFAHTLCALLIFYLWWNKPLDIGEPTKILGKQMREPCAFLCHRSNFDSFRGINFLRRQGDAEEPWAKHRMPATIVLQSQCSPSSTQMWLYEGQNYAGFFLYGLHNFWPPKRWHIRPVNDFPELYHHRILLSLADQQRYQYISKAYTRYGNTIANEDLSRAGRELLYKDTLKDRNFNWPFRSAKEPIIDSDQATIMAFNIAGLSYGALHLIAWSYPFSSDVQRILWRVSGVIIAASGPFSTCGVILGGFLSHILVEFQQYCVVQKADTWWKRFLRSSWWISLFNTINELVWLFGFIGIFFCALAYLFARVYLVLDCFLTFPYLPDLVFQQPVWSTYFPHIS